MQTTENTQKRNKIRRDFSGRVLIVVSYAVVILFACMSLFPFILLISGSFTSESYIMSNGYSLLPHEPTVAAYKLLLQNPDTIIGSYVVTILITAIGTGVGLLITAMTGYVLQRPDFAYRNAIAFYIYFTTLFSGGIVAYYITIVKWLGLKNNYLAIILPMMVTSWNVILMKNFMKGIPHEITESAMIDGASNVRIFFNIILPTATPALATVGLFLALSYWNEWYNSMLFLDNNVKYRPLQLFLYNVVNKADFIRRAGENASIDTTDIPMESTKLAVAVIATGPVILFYPFVQRYFIKGITIGSVKG